VRARACLFVHECLKCVCVRARMHECVSVCSSIDARRHARACAPKCTCIDAHLRN
jgi:hypothetical protein